MPQASPDGDQTEEFARRLAQWEDARVVLFPDTWPGDLDGFFRLRLLQVLNRRPPVPALSVVVLSVDMAGQPLAGGFADRFRFGWPFARCVFLTERDDHAALSALLGVPVKPLERARAAPEPIACGVEASQKIAVQVQRTLGRCGSTILFENQLESLVRSGFLTIRVFTDPRWRRGATMRSRLDALVQENSVYAGAHINVVAVPDGPPCRLEVEDADATWRILLAATALCRIADGAVVQAAGRAECVVANHLECFGPAITLSPQARLLLALHEDRAIALHHWATLSGRGEAAAMKSAAAAARVQTQILGMADLCTFVSVTEMTRLAPQCKRAVTILPLVYGAATLPQISNGVAPRFDLLLVGSEHGLNIVSLRWFLDRVWRPYLEARSVSVAIAGRAGDHACKAAYDSPFLHFLGFVEDLETIRSWCRMTVVPDTGGAGISRKMLTTLAAGHPIATTRVGLRGLDRSIAQALPAHNAAEALATDILALIDDPARLRERQNLVRQAGAKIRGYTDHADLVMTITQQTQEGMQTRLEQWSALLGASPGPDVVPYAFTFDAAFAMSGGPWDQQVLVEGWHEPEPWGRWTDGADAALRITLGAPASGPLTLELDIVPSAVAANLRVGVDGTLFPLLDPVPGPNGWDIPPELSAGKSSFLVTLHVGETVCPAHASDSPDHRILGIGVSAVRLLSCQPTLCVLNRVMPIRADAMPGRVLMTGWHGPEPWGCWTSKTSASLRLTAGEPMESTIRLELDIAVPPVAPALTLSVNGVTLPAITPADGLNSWDLPPKATNGLTELLVTLTVPDTFCATRAGQSTDDRELGIGLRGIRLVPVISAFCEPGIPLALGSATVPDEVLLSGWHLPEDWGCRTSERHAVLRLALRQPLLGPFGLEMDLMASPAATGLTLSVNGQALPMIVPVSGTNRWRLPESLTDEQQTLLIGLEVSDTHCPAEIADSPDKRIMGVGVRRVVLRREAAALCPIGTLVQISSDVPDRGMLLAGWYKPEPWGCWSAGPAASMLLRFGAPLAGTYALEFDMAPPLIDPSVALSIDDTVLDSISAVDGPNEWTLPRSCTDGKTELMVRLLVSRPARPMDVMDSKDDRILGVAVRSMRFRSARCDEADLV
ncbi:MAG: glycosyltransferase family 4 protein [Rhodopila sp.]